MTGSLSTLFKKKNTQKTQYLSGFLGIKATSKLYIVNRKKDKQNMGLSSKKSSKMWFYFC
jgi:hypothetical protein